MIERLDYVTINQSAIASMAAAKQQMPSIDGKLRALIELRISQINGCAYCIDLHACEARAAGETQQRLDLLSVWHECRFFEKHECAALAWAEAVTHLSNTDDSDALYDDLRDHFSDRQVVDMTIIIAQMNAWNRLAISFRHIPDARK